MEKNIICNRDCTSAVEQWAEEGEAWLDDKVAEGFRIISPGRVACEGYKKEPVNGIGWICGVEFDCPTVRGEMDGSIVEISFRHAPTTR